MKDSAMQAIVNVSQPGEKWGCPCEVWVVCTRPYAEKIVGELFYWTREQAEKERKRLNHDFNLAYPRSSPYHVFKAVIAIDHSSGKLKPQEVKNEL